MIFGCQQSEHCVPSSLFGEGLCIAHIANLKTILHINITCSIDTLIAAKHR